MGEKWLEHPESMFYRRVDLEVENKLGVAEMLLCHPEIHRGRARTQAVNEYTSARLFGKEAGVCSIRRHH